MIRYEILSILLAGLVYCTETCRHRKTRKPKQLYRFCRPRPSLTLTFDFCSQCLPRACRGLSVASSVLIAKAVFLLQRGQTSGQTDAPHHPIPVLWLSPAFAERKRTKYNRNLSYRRWIAPYAIYGS